MKTDSNPVPSGRTFKESPAQRFEEVSVSRVNGESNKTAEVDSAKWKSLSVSNVTARKEEPARVGPKDKGERDDGFARPTLRPSELPAATLMPPPSFPGKQRKEHMSSSFPHRDVAL